MGYRGGYRPNYNKQPQLSTPSQQQQDQGNRTTSGSDATIKIQEPAVSLPKCTESTITTSAATVEQFPTQGEINVIIQEVIPEPAMAGIFFLK